MTRRILFIIFLSVCLPLVCCDNLEEKKGDQIEEDTQDGGCEIGRFRCVDLPTGRQRCLSNGSWGPVELCDICIDGGNCYPSVCKPDTYSCDGSTLRLCNSIGDAYASHIECTDGEAICDATNGQCDICIQGEHGCNNEGTNRTECSRDGQSWIEDIPSSCAHEICINDGDCVECQPGEVECDVTRRYLNTCSSSGEWERYDCLGDSKTCFELQCQGVCAYGLHQCLSVTSQVCDGTGAWQTNEVCDYPDGLCEVAMGENYGLCVDNSPYQLGHYSSSGGHSVGTETRTIYATPVVATQDAFITSLGILPSATAGLAKLALYEDIEVSGIHVPGNRIAYSPTSFGLVADTISTVIPTGSPPQLTAGQTYWVAAVVDGAPSTYRFSPTGTKVVEAPVESFGENPPDPFPIYDPDTYFDADAERSIFLNVQNVQQQI